MIKGPEYMDEVRPGWYRQINLQRLNIASCYECIGGQLEGEYADFKHAVGLSELQAYELGFVVNSIGKTRDAIEENYNRLDEEWTQAVKDRLAFDEEVEKLTQEVNEDLLMPA